MRFWSSKLFCHIAAIYLSMALLQVGCKLKGGMVGFHFKLQVQCGQINYFTKKKPALKWAWKKENGFKTFFGPQPNPSQMYLLGFTMSRGRFVGYPCQLIIFHPRNFDDQSRKKLPEAFTHHLEENRKSAPMIIH